MTEQETIDFAELQDRLAAKEAECRRLRKELHDVRTHAQTLQNKLSLAELVLSDLRHSKSPTTDKPKNPSQS
jgi:predicted  nucleic acid-binding Zn-ribbon protein